MKLHSYPSIINFGHRLALGIQDDPVYVKRRVDGSQFSFGIDADGTVLTRSKGAEIFPETADKLFKGAVEYVHSIKGLLTQATRIVVRFFVGLNIILLLTIVYRAIMS